MDTKLVCLYRCNHCGCRMFDHDMRGHVERHGLTANGDLHAHFTRGKRDTSSVPGGNVKPLYQRAAPRKSSKPKSA